MTGIDQKTVLFSFLKSNDSFLVPVSVVILIVQMFNIYWISASKSSVLEIVLCPTVFLYTSYIQHVLIHEMFHNHAFSNDHSNRLMGLLLSLTTGVPFFEYLRKFHLEDHFEQSKESIIERFQNTVITANFQVNFLFQALFNLIVIYEFGIMTLFQLIFASVFAFMCQNAYHFENNCYCLFDTLAHFKTYHKKYPDIPVTRLLLTDYCF